MGTLRGSCEVWEQARPRADLVAVLLSFGLGGPCDCEMNNLGRELCSTIQMSSHGSWL